MNMEQITTDVANRHQVSVQEIRGTCRMKRVVVARKEAMTEIRKTGRYSTTQIGRYFRCHHTTVVHHTGTLGSKGG